MEEEFCGRKTAIEGILDESFGGGVLRSRLKMGQTSVVKAVGDSLSVHCLLSDAGNHLRQIDVGTF